MSQLGHDNIFAFYNPLMIALENRQENYICNAIDGQLSKRVQVARVGSPNV
jgi:hypothetical protein